MAAGLFFPSAAYYFNGTLIDTSTSTSWSYVDRFINKYAVNQVLVTHHHEDHSSNVFKILDANQEGRMNAKVLASRGCARILEAGFNMNIYEHLLYGKVHPSTTDLDPENEYQRINPIDTDTIMTRGALGEVELEVIKSPGHSFDQISFYEPKRKILFAGDAYLTDRTFFFRADEDYDLIVDTLRRLIALDVEVLCCGHTPVWINGREALSSKLAYMLETRDRIFELHERGMSPERIAHELFPRARKQLPLWIGCGGDVSPANIVRNALYGPVVRPCARDLL